jgi:hypothetical protein
MKSLTSAPTVASTLTSDLVSKIQQATRALPAAHLVTPAAGELFESREAALLRLQNWAFTQGFAVATQSVRKDRSIFECVHHGKKTATVSDLRQQQERRPASGQYMLASESALRVRGYWVRLTKSIPILSTQTLLLMISISPNSLDISRLLQGQPSTRAMRRIQHRRRCFARRAYLI